ncbi:hypothetical protein QI155_05775 [Thermodesulfovibrio sp. 1176]|uniref:hypothetical protein n=1 Tax=Thermodesulfovibrio sp. 1176 TaxID=3043424 RepID=UPI0024822DB0|nr:hypothetical protein [Thermodesulfovibrio sp. 1176]MDI1472042.1 hypothetical protein [Thermodesulfovibrio sp. 1176]
MKKKLIFIITLIYLLIAIPTIIFASCDQALKDCTSEVEKGYKECLETKHIVVEINCHYIKGYKPDSWDYMKCEKDFIKQVQEDCRKRYQKNTDACYSAYKKCRKGDIFGKILMEISWASGQEDNPIHKGSAYFTIMGFWKYKPEESNEYVKNYRPEGLQMMTRFEETVNERYSEKGCPSLLYNYHGGGARVLMVDPNVDYPNNPMGRLIIVDMPSKPPKEAAKFLPKEIKKLYGPFYKVGFGPGDVIEIKGIERVGDRKPECSSYKGAKVEISFGEFLISDDFKLGTMSGSESWVSCRGDWYVREQIDFQIAKDKITVSEEGKPEYHPDKAEGNCGHPGTEKIRVNWKFYLIK